MSPAVQAGAAADRSRNAVMVTRLEEHNPYQVRPRSRFNNVNDKVNRGRAYAPAPTAGQDSTIRSASAQTNQRQPDGNKYFFQHLYSRPAGVVGAQRSRPPSTHKTLVQNQHGPQVYGDWRVPTYLTTNKSGTIDNSRGNLHHSRSGNINPRFDSRARASSQTPYQDQPDPRLLPRMHSLY